MAAKFHTGHVGINVTRLGRSSEFYQAVFGFEVMAESREQGREFVFLAHDGKLVLTLWQQADGPFEKTRAGLHHLSFQVDGIDDVRAAQQKLEQLGVALFHDGIVPHGEGANSGGIFFEDPDGTRLEIYAPSGAGAHAAPTPGAPTCGFF